MAPRRDSGKLVVELVLGVSQTLPVQLTTSKQLHIEDIPVLCSLLTVEPIPTRHGQTEPPSQLAKAGMVYFRRGSQLAKAGMVYFCRGSQLAKAGMVYFRRGS